MNRKLINLLCFCTFLASFGAAAAENSTIILKKTVPFSKGITFSRWLESDSRLKLETTLFDKNDFVNIKNMGADVIRIPISFAVWSANNSEHTIEQLLFKHLDNIVSWANEIKVNVIFVCADNIYDSNLSTQEIEQYLTAIWTQMAIRYSASSEYIYYEISEEPHNLNYTQWGLILGSIISTIRTYDKNHQIIISGTARNSIDGLLALPDFYQTGLIYSFAFYEPFAFTHQGADWASLSNLLRLPFPFDKTAMPQLSEKASSMERQLYSSYESDSIASNMAITIENAVQFANRRQVPLICTSFGVYQKYVKDSYAASWYKTVSDLMDKHLVARITKEFSGDFGLFKYGSKNIFPEDLSIPVVRSLGFEVPTYRLSSWFDDAKKNKNYSIYKNGFAPKIRFNCSLPDDGKNANLYVRDTKSGELFINIPEMGKYHFVEFNFVKAANFTELARQNACITLCVRTTEPNIKMQIWFEDSDSTDYPWRLSTFITKEMAAPDGEWHTISIPFSDLIDSGAYDFKTQTFIRGKGLFRWTDIIKIKLQNENENLSSGIQIKYIGIN